MRRVVVLLAVLSVVGLVAAPGHAEGVAFPDPAGDASFPQGDIVAFTAVYSADLLTLGVKVAEPTDPITAPEWQTGLTVAVWKLDVAPYDGQMDYEVVFGAPGQHLVAGVYTGPNQPAVCYGTPLFTQGAYLVQLSASCIGAPLGISLRAEFFYNPNATPDPWAPVGIDRAPDGDAYAGPIARTGATPPTPDGEVTRLAGVTRLETAVAVSRDTFADGQAGAVVLASAADFPDALVGVPLAAARNAPVLLTDPAALDTATLAEIHRATGGGKPVYLLGGPSAVSTAVETQLTAAGYLVSRYGGADRYETAVAVARALGDPSLMEATGTDFPDALAAGTAAVKNHSAVILTAGPSMPAATAAYIAEHPTRARYTIGGAAASADPAAMLRIVGADRYDTAVRVAETFFRVPAVAGIASGLNYPDALAGAPHTAHLGGPLLLTSPAALPASTAGYLHTNAVTISHAYVYGGTAAIADPVLQQVRAAIG